MERVIEIDGKEIKFRATAALPRLYRIKFRSDMLQDMARLSEAYSKAQTKEEQFAVTDLEVFENCAYMMARHADPESVSQNIEDWLENFEAFSIYYVLPHLLELWGLNTETTSENKKKLIEAAAK